MRLRWCVVTLAVMLVAAGCGSGKTVNEGLSGSSTTIASGGGGNNASTPTAPEICKTAKLTSPEIGVSPSTITVTVMADTGSPIKPGLFQGSVDAVKAWANYVNDNGGLACRKVAVNVIDSKLDPQASKNGIATACGNSLAMVGTTALFLQDVSPLENCKDKAGNSHTFTDIAELQTEPAQQCSPESFATLPPGYSCPYSGSGLRKFQVGYTTMDYYKKQFPGLALHGTFVIPKDLSSTIEATMVLFRAENQMGVKSDAEIGMSGLATQPDYTAVADAIKAHNSNYARNGTDYSGTLYMRKEAQAQGVTSVKIWDCSVQCYDKRLLAGGSATEGQYVWLNILPMEDGNANPELASFLKYDTKPDGFGEQAWVAGEIFATAVRNAMSANNNDPNAITRANVLAAVKNLHSFDANGMVPTIDVGAKVGSTCLVGMQIKNGKFVRVDPLLPGKFDCDLDPTTGQPKPPLTFTIDPLKEYHG